MRGREKEGPPWSQTLYKEFGVPAHLILTRKKGAATLSSCRGGDRVPQGQATGQGHAASKGSWERGRRAPRATSRTPGTGRASQSERDSRRLIFLTLGQVILTWPEPRMLTQETGKKLPKTQPFPASLSPGAPKPGRVCPQSLPSFHTTLLGQCHLGHVSPNRTLGGSGGQVAWGPIPFLSLTGSLNLPL